MKKFLSIVVIAGLSLSLVACSLLPQKDSKFAPSKATTSSSSKSKTSSSEEKAPVITLYNVGETITFDSGLEFTITSAQLTDERNQYAESNPAKVINITYNFTNNSKEPYTLGTDMTLTQNSQSMETYPLDLTVDTVAPGASVEGAVQAFALTSDTKTTLVIVPNFGVTNEKALVEIPAQ